MFGPRIELNGKNRHPSVLRRYWSKSKVKLYRYHHAGAKWEKVYGSYLFFTSTLDGDELSASCPGRALRPRKDPVPVG
jgi:hypothetical protein